MGDTRGQEQNYKKGGRQYTFYNWDNHTRENCYNLVGYPPGHRLHKGNQTGVSKPDRAAYLVLYNEENGVGLLPSPLTIQNGGKSKHTTINIVFRSM